MAFSDENSVELVHRSVVEVASARVRREQTLTDVKTYMTVLSAEEKDVFTDAVLKDLRSWVYIAGLLHHGASERSLRKEVQRMLDID